MLRNPLSRHPAVEDDALVFGQPYDTSDGATVITVARTGSLLRGTYPLGVFVVHGGQVVWTPAVDVTRIALIGLLTAVIATLAVLRRPPWPDLKGYPPLRR
ncbi:hypothetical protein [Nocardia sp. NPDC005998]|uniref:hypothetical protein n=1 Tax=Nocardia sp. NPDC005998 TaxID=3156894 RepID=UPI0033B39516